MFCVSGTASTVTLGHLAGPDGKSIEFSVFTRFDNAGKLAMLPSASHSSPSHAPRLCLCRSRGSPNHAYLFLLFARRYNRGIDITITMLLEAAVPPRVGGIDMGLSSISRPMDNAVGKKKATMESIARLS